MAGYHFGSKADLVRAITRRFTAEVERSRVQMLARLDDSAGLEELLGCLVRPWTDRFEALGPNSYFARVCAQAMNSPTLRPIVVEEGSHSDSLEQTWEALDKYLPGRADLSTELRRDMMQHLIVFVCAEREGALAEGRPTSRQTWADEANGLIDALQGIITAPMTDLAPSPVRRRPYGRVTARTWLMRSLSDLFRNFVQLGYVTDDIDAAAAFLESTMGAGRCVKSYASSLGGGRPPVSARAPRSAFVVVDGVPADEWRIDVALVNAGSTNLEIIRPVHGAVGLYRDAVRRGDAGHAAPRRFRGG